VEARRNPERNEMRRLQKREFMVSIEDSTFECPETAAWHAAQQGYGI
jgi:hypothetical protein